MSTHSHPDPAQGLPEKPRNPETTARFKRETWWQITFPVLVVAILSVGAVALLFHLSGEQGTAVVADYSLILIIIPTLLLGLLAVLLIGGSIYVVMQLMAWIPPRTYAVQKVMDTVHKRVDKVTDGIASVVIAVRSALIGINLFLQQRAAASEPSATPSPQETSAATDSH